MRATLALVALLATPALAAEETVTIDTPLGPVVGTLETPEGDPAPVVLMFHGFTGSRDELPVANTDEGVFSRTARLLSEQGIASLRIDFRGSGESPGAFADTTFEGQVADGLAALQWLEANPAVDGQRLAVLGWSQGGLVATAVAGRSDKPDALVLWAAVADPEESFGGIVGTETLANGLAAGDAPIPVALPWGAVVELKRGFFEGVTSFDPPAELASYSGPLFVAHGTQDTTVLPSAVDTFLAAHEGEESSWIAEMDHVFNAFTGPETLDQMVAETLAFLQPHLQ